MKGDCISEWNGREKSVLYMLRNAMLLLWMFCWSCLWVVGVRHAAAEDGGDVEGGKKAEGMSH